MNAMTRVRRAVETVAMLVLVPSASTAQTYPLIGVTGDGATVPETLYLLNQTNASALFVMTLGNGADGEAIAFNPDDGLLYHGSGVTFGDRFWESVDVLGKTIVSSDQFTGPDVSASHETLSIGYDSATQTFLAADRNHNLFATTLAGDATLLGALPGPIKGLAFASGSLYGADQSTSTLYELDPTDGSVISSVGVTLGGNPIQGMNGLATHPQTGQVWGIFRQGFNPGTRHLGTVDPTTGVATSVGILADNYAGIAFLPEPSSTTALAAGVIAVALGVSRRRA